MKVKSLRVSQFRNIETASLLPSPELNVLLGDNGQGKTNLLESIWLLTGSKSFRASKDGELIRRGEDFAAVESLMESGGREQTLEIQVGTRESQAFGRTAKVNGGARKRASSAAGIFNCVVFFPDHLSLVKGSPSERRKFLDAALCQLYPSYLALLRRFLRVSQQKNALLKQYASTRDAAGILDILNEDFCTVGEAVTKERKKYLARLSPLTQKNYRELSQGREELDLVYRASFGESLAEKVCALRETEIRAGFCLAGPQREDIEVLLDGESAKVYGSQGQQRSAVLSLKLAEASVAEEVTEEHPVMLLDDVLSELDEERQSYLLHRMQGKQIFVTSCEKTAFLRTDGKLFRVQGGKVMDWS